MFIKLRLKSANLQTKLQFLGDLLNYLLDLSSHNNNLVANLNLNLFAKLVLVQLINDFLTASQQDTPHGIAMQRMFIYFMRVVLNEFSDNQFVMNLIVLLMFKPRIHRDLHAIATESIRNETMYLKEKRFESLFEEREPETFTL